MNATVAAALWITLLSVVWGVVTSLRICAWLGSRRQEVDFLLLRLKLFEYVGRYRRMSRAERGEPGPLYAQFVASWLIALASAVTAGFMLLLPA